MSRFALLLPVVALLATGCPGGNSRVPAGGDPQRMSESEYDIARDLWLRQRKPREALAHVLEALELDDENADAAHLAALIYLDFCSSGAADCRLGEAEKHARQALTLRKDYREARNTLGVVLVHQKRYGDAVAVLKPLTADILYQTPENAWGNLGWAYLEQGKLDLAIDSLRRAVAAQPLFCVGHFRLGSALERKGQITEALDAYSAAVSTEAPGCSALQEAWAARGRLYVKLGKREEADSDLLRCIELSARTAAAKECRSMRANLK
ncbi:MAG: tetratricopeptide repeat protein [Polyangiaceae bacterium]|nr:tetratricopeptide repeat protein [Polyangiaceae bacterium]